MFVLSKKGTFRKGFKCFIFFFGNMRTLSGTEEQKAKELLLLEANIAKDATCTRSQCGSVIVTANMIIGKGYNSPPHDEEGQRRCASSKERYHKKVTDKTCCMHAEQRAIMDALRTHPDTIVGSRLYFIRLDEKGEMSHAGKPYCTICSKMALDVGIV